MKNFILLLVCSFVFSCDVIIEEVIENSFDKKNSSLIVSIKNNTPYDFKRTEVIMEHGTVVFQIIDSGFYGTSDQFPCIYDDIEIRIQTETKNFYNKPFYFKKESKETEGSFTFNVSLTEDDKLVIKRIKH